MNLRSSIDWNAQVLESLEADFEKMTWTFGLTGCTRVGCGQYAILWAETYQKQQSRLAWAERILRGLCDTETATTIGGKNYEAIHAFFDPEPLV